METITEKDFTWIPHHSAIVISFADGRNDGEDNHTGPGRGAKVPIFDKWKYFQTTDVMNALLPSVIWKVI